MPESIGKKQAGHQPKQSRKLPGLNMFWSTVVMVELMDLTFSIDNVFAAVAYTNNIYLICTGVFIGIVSMRIVAGYFVKLMEKFPFLDTVAFVVIGILGLRLCCDFFCVYFPATPVCNLLQGGQTDYYFSILTALVFFLPIATSIAFNSPGKKNRPFHSRINTWMVVRDICLSNISLSFVSLSIMPWL